MSTSIIVRDLDGVIALALEMMQDNPGLGEFEAVNRAVEMLDELDAVAAAWNADGGSSEQPRRVPIETAAQAVVGAERVLAVHP